LDRIEYVRWATLKDLDRIYSLAQEHTKELGYISRPVIERAIRERECIVVDISSNIVGFAKFHKTRQRITTLYSICVSKDYRGKGFGKAMIQFLQEHNHRNIQLKCPTDNESNNFYKHLGFKLYATVPGKKRSLNIWRTF